MTGGKKRLWNGLTYPWFSVHFFGIIACFPHGGIGNSDVLALGFNKTQYDSGTEIEADERQAKEIWNMGHSYHRFASERRCDIQVGEAQTEFTLLHCHDGDGGQARETEDSW